MWRTLPPTLVCLAAAWAGGCSDDLPARVLDPTVLFDEPALGLSFELPADWVVAEEGELSVFSGEPGTDAQFTNLLVQASAGPPEPSGGPGEPQGPLARLEAAVYEAYAAAPEVHKLRFVVHRPHWQPDAPTPSLVYLAAFELWEQPRLRAAVLFPMECGVVEISYTAPEELFATSLGVWEQALDSLALEPPCGWQKEM